jgi:hypothetical protein
MVFWASALAVGSATFAVLTVVARRPDAATLADATSLVGLTLILAVPPGALQLAVAARVARGEAVPRAPLRVGVAACACLVLAAPPLAWALSLPVAGVAAAMLYLGPALAVARDRGTAIGANRLLDAAASLGIDALVRLVAGIALALALGATGVAVAILLAPAVALAVHRTSAHARTRSASAGDAAAGLAAPALAFGALIALVNVDVLVAPRALPAGAADAYAAAAVPAKGLFFVLFALSWLTVRPAVRDGRVRSLVRPIAATLVLGLAGTGALALGRPVLEAVLDRPIALDVLVPVGVAMACAAAVATAGAMAVARRASPAWAAMLGATLAVAAAAVTLAPAPSGLAAGTVVAAVVALLVALRRLLGTAGRPLAAAPAQAAAGGAP